MWNQLDILIGTQTEEFEYTHNFHTYPDPHRLIKYALFNSNMSTKFETSTDIDSKVLDIW